MNAMTVLVSLGLLVTLGTLALGLGSMAQGGEYDDVRAVRLMFARVVAQAVTVVLLGLALIQPLLK